MLNWISKDIKPEGCERKMLLWIEYPENCRWYNRPEAKIGWWKHGPGCFAFGEFENADHLVTHYAEITEPNK